MSKTEAPAVHIPREHQSAPAEHWADKEVRKAAEEIQTGQFTPSEDPDDFLAIGLQRGLAIQNPNELGAGKLALIQETADSLALAQHPRVKEALERLDREKREARSSQEMLEKGQMLHEMNQRAAQKNQWDGQGRWLGKENEEMRIVNILTPQQWLEKLKAVIGERRVFINRFAVLNRVAVLVPNTEANRSLILIPGLPEMPRDRNTPYLAAATLQWPCGPEWMIPKFDEYGVPVRARYLGWRTALLCLINKKVISEKEAHQAFPLGTGPAGDWYHQQLFEMRSREGVVN
jgi:hypothetical protein